MKSKIICLLLAMIMVIATLVSCGGDGEQGGQGGGQGGGGSEGGGSEGGGQGGGYDVYWRSTPIVYQLTEASDSKTFTAGTRRYYAGDSKGSTEEIDIMIGDRNDAAERVTNVTIDYQYLADTGANDWSKSVETIYKNSTVYTPGSSVDIYCNFTYDLTCASVKNCFANLKANTDLVSTVYGLGNNYFRFNESDYKYIGESYFDSKVGEGYFYQYMLSLTLSDDKVYCLGSDYCTDLVRAFHVIPVNIELMNTLSVDMLPEGGVDKDGNAIVKDADETNIQYFYEIVWAGNWTFDVLAKYSRAIFADAGTEVEGGKSGADITDRLGFAISTNGIPSSGILYTSTVEILDKKSLTDAERDAALNNEKEEPFVAGNYLITYPASNPDFVAYADALNNLFVAGDSAGICVEANFSLIRQRFISGDILFGNLINLGALEDSDYQEMRNGEGFGIIPVPVYREGDEYQTFVHNNSRIVAIARMTDRYEQCAAYLDYQSRNSSEILEKYYTEELAQQVRNASGDDNERMLTYIRNHVRNVFDKTYEDIMGDYNKTTDAQAAYRRWHEVFARDGYKVTGMSGEYDQLTPEKASDLAKVIKEWNALGTK